MAANVLAASYRYQFVCEPSETLKCLICLDVAEEPWQHGDCGSLFCKKCLDQYTKPCPHCNAEEPKYFNDSKSKKEIRALVVKCNHVNSGCEWVGTVGTLQEHMATCEFAPLPCPNQCKDDNEWMCLIMRKDLNKHLKEECPNRDYTCEYCEEKGTYASITNIHDKTCPKKILPCPIKGCEQKMQRQHIEKHTKTECPHAIITCTYLNIGCHTKLKRVDMEAHEKNSEVHLSMALEKINFLQENHTTLKKGGSIILKVGDYQKRKVENEYVQSPSYYIFPNGYHMALRVYTNGADGQGTHVSVFATITEGRYDSELKWPYTGKIIFTMLNQLEDKNHCHLTITVTELEEFDPMGSNNTRGLVQFIPNSELGYDPVRNTQYLKDDTLYFRMEVKVANRKPWLE